MGLFWRKADADEETEARRIYFLSRRILLCALVLSALLLMPVTAARSSLRYAVWAIFIWSLILGIYAVRAFVHARSLYRQKSSELGLVDALTGLPNRKGLLAAIEQFDIGPQDLGKRIRLIDIDLQNLNRVNYEYGQMVGDAVLQDIAGLIRTNTPPECVVGRLGGDEFLVLMPAATAEDAESLAARLRAAIGSYKLNIGERGEVGSLTALVSVANYVPEKASLHETIVGAKEAGANGELPDAGTGAPCYHVPRVTLGAFAVHRWQNLNKGQQEEFKLWKRAPGNKAPEALVDDIVRLLDEKAEINWVDFVTTVPAAGTGGATRIYAARVLAEAVAERLGVPYRDVMRADASGPESRTVEPAVDAVIDKGDSVLLVSDVISSGILERRCVKKLSAAGAHVQVVAWAAY